MDDQELVFELYRRVRLFPSAGRKRAVDLFRRLP
jgi:hypothetical protein